MSAKIDIKFDTVKILHDLGITDMRLQRLLATQIIIISDPYVPFRDGYLKNSARIEDGGKAISYGATGPSNAYARRWYYESANFNGAPIRGTRWVERAWNDNGQAVIKNIERKLKGGKL